MIVQTAGSCKHCLAFAAVEDKGKQGFVTSAAAAKHRMKMSKWQNLVKTLWVSCALDRKIQQYAYSATPQLRVNSFNLHDLADTAGVFARAAATAQQRMICFNVQDLSHTGFAKSHKYNLSIRLVDRKDDPQWIAKTVNYSQHPLLQHSRKRRISITGTRKRNIGRCCNVPKKKVALSACTARSKF